MGRSPLYKIGLMRFLGPDGRPRGLLLDRCTHTPSICGSVYESYLSGHLHSHNSLYADLGHFAALLSFGVETDIDLERRLLSGQEMKPSEIDGFARWLIVRFNEVDGGLRPAKVKTLNARLRGARLATEWFINQFLNVDDVTVARSIAVEQAIANSRRSWKRNFRRQVGNVAAPDLSEEDLSAIESFLRNASSGNKPEPMWVRAYLIWRLVIEFGFRIGEILGFRLEDCPSRTSTTFEVVRIEERTGPSDPRGVYAPRPKTLSRALAPVLSNSVFPRLVVDYQADHRLRYVRTAAGKIVKRPIFSHQFLLVNDNGDPLPSRSAGNLAQCISRETGVRFHWHLARHAFFNRAYSAVAQIADLGAREVHLQDLVHWGGWSDASSLDIYVQSARKKRAAMGLAVWNGARSDWSALS